MTQRQKTTEHEEQKRKLMEKNYELKRSKILYIISKKMNGKNIIQ